MNNPSPEAPQRDIALLFTAEEVAQQVGGLADEIASAMADPFTAVIILKGAFMFGADLIRALSRRGRHPRVEFIRLESYGHALQTSGTVSLRSPRPAAIEGRPVLIVDDVLDSGLTLREAKRQARREWRGISRAIRSILFCHLASSVTPSLLIFNQ